MIRPHFHAIGLALALGLAFVPAVGKGEVVFGNLGSAGNAALSSTSTTTGTNQPTSLSLAAAFTTGTNAGFLKLASITLGLAGETTVNRSVQLWTASNGVPGSPIAEMVSSTVLVNSAPQQLYTFAFPSLPALQPSTTYWIVPGDPILWYNTGLGGSSSFPVEHNSSGYTRPTNFIALLEAGVPDPAWFADNGPRLAYSISAVPEQGTLPLAGIGLVGAGWAMRRMKRRSAAETVASEAVNDAGV
jgi:hypothetical protein